MTIATAQSTGQEAAREPKASRGASRGGQPRAVWAVAFACVIAFMGIGLVDPILPAISASLGATPAQSMLLFTSYLVITSITMFFSSFTATRIGAKNTLMLGIALIIVFATLAGFSSTIGQVIGFRAGWGLGNALFISTALSTIVGAAAGGARKAIILYEAALGIGIATGPVLGGILGDISWRGPFFGTAALLSVGLIAILAVLPKQHQQVEKTSLSAPFVALTHPGIAITCVVAVLYNFGFFTLLAYAPFPLDEAAREAGMTTFGAHELGAIFFGWGVLLAITSVVVAPRLTHAIGHVRVIAVSLVALAMFFCAMAAAVHNVWALAALVVVAGAFFGVMNTVMTELVMEVSDVPRPVASSTYSGIRFLGGAVSPVVAGTLSGGQPFMVAAACVLAGAIIVAAARRRLVVLEHAA